ncbi:MAG: radical SAM family heme chaperone HemW [Pseudomonadota bacterium]
MNGSVEDWREGGFGLYVHWPFCLAKCPYCDFNSHVWREVDQKRWRQALLAEMRAMHARAPGRHVDTVFFGGGTPSLMPAETVAALIREADRLWGLSSTVEITLEANPTSVEAERFRGYSEAGVNRVSMGVQALNDRDLKALGRTHSATEARAAFDVARSVFDRVSFDLIYARSGQTEHAWRAELREAIDMAIDHLSLYQLTIEPGTRFADLYDLGKLSVPEDDAAAALYEATQEICEAAGMPAYEVSNHARPSAESQHNRLYWRYGDYAGVGPGAHGRLTGTNGRFATETIRDPSAWMTQVEGQGDGLASVAPVTSQEQAAEMLMMGLRLIEGVRLDRYARLSGEEISQKRLHPLAEDGIIEIDSGRLRVTDAGRPVLNAVLRALLA